MSNIEYLRSLLTQLEEAKRLHKETGSLSKICHDCGIHSFEQLDMWMEECRQLMEWRMVPVKEDRRWACVRGSGSDVEVHWWGWYNDRVGVGNYLCRAGRKVIEYYNEMYPYTVEGGRVKWTGAVPEEYRGKDPPHVYVFFKRGLWTQEEFDKLRGQY